MRSLHISYIYYILKLIDLLDTVSFLMRNDYFTGFNTFNPLQVFFVLRKKDNQMSFLHLYHHGGMVLMTWIVTKYYAGGVTLAIPAINCLVHIVMYAYYLLSVYNKEYKKSIWWKKHITQLQLVCIFYSYILR